MALLGSFPALNAMKKYNVTLTVGFGGKAERCQKAEVASCKNSKQQCVPNGEIAD